MVTPHTTIPATKSTKRRMNRRASKMAGALDHNHTTVLAPVRSWCIWGFVQNMCQRISFCPSFQGTSMPPFRAVFFLLSQTIQMSVCIHLQIGKVKQAVVEPLLQFHLYLREVAGAWCELFCPGVLTKVQSKQRTGVCQGEESVSLLPRFTNLSQLNDLQMVIGNESLKINVVTTDHQVITKTCSSKVNVVKRKRTQGKENGSIFFLTA